jgi:hypothetical protein
MDDRDDDPATVRERLLAEIRAAASSINKRPGKRDPAELLAAVRLILEAV